MTTDQARYQYLLRFADTSLVMAQRLAEWCSRGPILEEDLALTNISLDYFGQAEAFYNTAIPFGGKQETADDLAFRRSEREYFNFLIAEADNGDYARTMMKIYLLSAYLEKIYTALSTSSQPELNMLGVKSLKEIMYHKRHSSAWLFRLAHGTAESASRVQQALQDVWSYTDDLFSTDVCDELLSGELNYEITAMKHVWFAEVEEFMKQCGFVLPQTTYQIQGGIKQMHTEALGHVLCEMQYLQRAYPNAKW